MIQFEDGTSQPMRLARKTRGSFGGERSPAAIPQHQPMSTPKLPAMVGPDTSQSITGALQWSIGLRTIDGKVVTLLARGTQLPAEATVICSTAENEQSMLEVQLYETWTDGGADGGADALAQDNQRIDSIVVRGIPPMARGVPRVEVKLTAGSTGALQVDAFFAGAGQCVEYDSQGAISHDNGQGRFAVFAVNHPRQKHHNLFSVLFYRVFGLFSARGEGR
jgi:hypothetical protein